MYVRIGICTCVDIVGVQICHTFYLDIYMSVIRYIFLYIYSVGDIYQLASICTFTQNHIRQKLEM